MDRNLLEIDGVTKYYGDNHVLKNVSFDIRDGEFLTLLGPSGCGKTTLLRCIAGLEKIDSGDILLKNESIKALPANKRNVNTVFQNYALFPHLNVRDNIAYGPRVKKSMSRSELEAKIGEVLELVKMKGYESRMPQELSGGEKQRIAIARALINKPDILLLDEPLGALDLKLRKYMQKELAHLQREAKTTFVYVTHDQEEALNMSDRIAVMDKGTILQIGSPSEIYNEPADLFVASFIGDRNISQVTVVEKNDDHVTIRLGSNVINVRCSNKAGCDFKSGDKAYLAVHMDKMRIACEQALDTLKGKVGSIHYAGSQIRIEIDVDGSDFTVIEYQKNECLCGEGDTVWLSWEEKGGVLLPLLPLPGGLSV